MQTQSQRAWLFLAPIAFLGLLAPDYLHGHHSTAGYDLIHGTIITGVVARFDMLNPHGIIALDVSGEADGLEHWTVAVDSPLALRRLGWSRNTLKSGDKITVIGNRAKDGSFHLRGVEIQLPDGRKLVALQE